MTSVRVRFAPSPTGPLHIGGVRTALYNYLFAKKNNGTFILRIEDTDQQRYVSGAEKYIIDSLRWFGMTPDEGPGFGGDFGPYRQSERKDIYAKYAEALLQSGNAYYAFDTPEELEALRANDPTFKYDGKSRNTLKNSLTLPKEEVEVLLQKNEYIAIRLKMPSETTISFVDEIRGHVSFASSELDDKVILKGDGMPTYHLANIVDDHLMEITHVIRGEEWLSSTAHHVFMHQCMGWNPPSFSHLPLILKPTGKGKLSKRDGAKFGFPVFPLSWNGEAEDSFIGFNGDGFLPEAVLNFLALLGWSPGNEQEIFTLDELSLAFSLDKIVKSGARFDIEKAKWFNQQYIIQSSNEHLAENITDMAKKEGYDVSKDYLSSVCELMKERVHKTHEIIENARFYFEPPVKYDDITISKKFNQSFKEHLLQIAERIETSSKENIEKDIKGYIADQALKMGDIMSLLRIAICGTMQGPDLLQSIILIGFSESAKRISKAIQHFEYIINQGIPKNS